MSSLQLFASVLDTFLCAVTTDIDQQWLFVSPPQVNALDGSLKESLLEIFDFDAVTSGSMFVWTIVRRNTCLSLSLHMFCWRRGEEPRSLAALTVLRH